MEEYKCELDEVDFDCNKCGGTFSHVDGTWLPTGKLLQQDYCTILPEGYDPRFPTTPAVFFSLREPVIETSEDFTCYDCCNNEGNEFMRNNYDVS